LGPVPAPLHGAAFPNARRFSDRRQNQARKIGVRRGVITGWCAFFGELPALRTPCLGTQRSHNGRGISWGGPFGPGLFSPGVAYRKTKKKSRAETLPNNRTSSRYRAAPAAQGRGSVQKRNGTTTNQGRLSSARPNGRGFVRPMNRNFIVASPQTAGIAGIIKISSEAGPAKGIDRGARSRPVRPIGGGDHGHASKLQRAVRNSPPYTGGKESCSRAFLRRSWACTGQERKKNQRCNFSGAHFFSGAAPAVGSSLAREKNGRLRTVIGGRPAGAGYGPFPGLGRACSSFCAAFLLPKWRSQW